MPLLAPSWSTASAATCRVRFEFGSPRWLSSLRSRPPGSLGTAPAGGHAARRASRGRPPA
eukprot:4213929-Alexandrium_andersonii.AAC.1